MFRAAVRYGWCLWVLGCAPIPEEPSDVGTADAVRERTSPAVALLAPWTPPEAPRCAPVTPEGLALPLPEAWGALPRPRATLPLFAGAGDFAQRVVPLAPGEFRLRFTVRAPCGAARVLAFTLHTTVSRVLGVTWAPETGRRATEGWTVEGTVERLDGVGPQGPEALAQPAALVPPPAPWLVTRSCIGKACGIEARLEQGPLLQLSTRPLHDAPVERPAPGTAVALRTRVGRLL